tara:strand:+ start:7260 stop:8714 length:1455 start_codon:yes stop_codon:yes gene_type:complete
MKISLLALASAVAAVPQYGHGHSKYHSLKPSGAHGTGGAKPYPTGGWNGQYNSTRVPYPTGTGSYDEDKTIDVTTTSTTTVLKTVVVKASPVSSSQKAVVENATPAADQCGPATVTVTASEKVTITVTPNGGADVPKSSAAPVESKGEGYGVLSSFALVSPTPKGEEVPVVSSKAVEVKPSPTPEAAVSSKVEDVKSTPTPEAPVSSKAAEEYKISSIIQKPVASPTPASSSPAPSATPSTSNTYTGSKRGLAYNDATLCKGFSGMSFAYNWAQVESNDIGTNYIPMMHGPSKATSQEWLANVKKAVQKGSKAVMGFNEPDHAEQANLSPAAACAAWKEYMNPIASSYPEVTIIGPSVTNAGSENPSMGLNWLSSFQEACPDAVVHATNIHFYDVYDEGTIERFKAQVEKASALTNKPIWVTEFGLNPGATEDHAALFLKECMAYLDNNNNVQGYSYFMVGSGENQLLLGSGLSKVGEVYASGP